MNSLEGQARDKPTVKREATYVVRVSAALLRSLVGAPDSAIVRLESYGEIEPTEEVTVAWSEK